MNMALKLYFKEPRLYFLSDRIIPTACPIDFGFPSGHGMGTSILFLSFSSIYTQERHFKKAEKALVYSGAILLCFIVMYTRLYAGIHSIDQLVAGLLLGLGLFFFYEAFIKPSFYSLCSKIDNRSLPAFSIFFNVHTVV